MNRTGLDAASCREASLRSARRPHHCGTARQGRAAEALVEEAVERLVDSEEWFLQEVDNGLAAADRGEFIDHGDIRNMIDSRYPG